VFTLKLAVDAPGGILIDGGTVNCPVLLVRATSEPARGAALDSITVQVAVPFKLIDDGAQLTDLRLGSVSTDKTATWEALLYEPTTTAVPSELGVTEEIGKLAIVCP
jgi:hypothetical protein